MDSKDDKIKTKVKEKIILLITLKKQQKKIEAIGQIIVVCFFDRHDKFRIIYPHSNSFLQVKKYIHRFIVE